MPKPLFFIKKTASNKIKYLHFFKKKMGTHFLGFPKVFFYKKSKVLFTYLFLYIGNFPKSAKMGTHFFKTLFDLKPLLTSREGGAQNPFLTSRKFFHKPFFDFKRVQKILQPPFCFPKNPTYPLFVFQKVNSSWLLRGFNHCLTIAQKVFRGNF